MFVFVWSCFVRAWFMLSFLSCVSCLCFALFVEFRFDCLFVHFKSFLSLEWVGVSGAEKKSRGTRTGPLVRVPRHNGRQVYPALSPVRE